MGGSGIINFTDGHTVPSHGGPSHMQNINTPCHLTSIIVLVLRAGEITNLMSQFLPTQTNVLDLIHLISPQVRNCLPRSADSPQARVLGRSEASPSGPRD